MLSFKTFYLEAHNKKLVDLYRGISGRDEQGFSKERIVSIHNNGQDVYNDARSKTKSIFIRTWLQGNYTGIMQLLLNHTRDDAKRIYGLISYTVSPDVANSFSNTGDVNTLKLPAKHIISSKKRLKQVLNLPNHIKKKYLKDGVGFNINRLFWNISAHDTTDGESEITVFKWE